MWLGRNLLKAPPVSGILVHLTMLLMALVLVPPRASGQDLDPGVRGAYFRVVAEHFEVPVEEVTILGDWDLTPDEVPVVLFLSGRAGVSPDALIGLRLGGMSWTEVAARFRQGVGSFYISLPQDIPLGILDRAYEEFRSRSLGEWDQIQLNDLEITSLVNIRVLSEQVGVPPLRVLQSRDEAGSFVAGFASLIGGTHGL